MGEAESLALWAVLFRDVGVAVLPTHITTLRFGLHVI